MRHFLLIYQLTPEYLPKRPEFRNEHLGLAWEFQRSGKLGLGGALAEPVDQSILLFQCETPAEIEEFVRRDPYVANGLVKSWEIRLWTTVVGDLAISPVYPS